MKRLLYILLPIIAILVGCNGSDTDKMLSSVDSLCMTNPDSALKILDGIDQNGLSEYNRAYYCFIYTKARDKADIAITDDSLIRIAYDYYRQHEAEQPYAQTMYYMGKYYYLKDSIQQSKDCLLSSVIKAKANKEYYTASLAANRMCFIFQQSNPAEAMKYAKEAMKYYECMEEPTFKSNKVHLMESIAKCHTFSQQIDSAVYTYDMALKCAEDLNDKPLQSEVLTEKGIMYAYCRNYEEALNCANNALAITNSPTETLQYLLFHCYGSLELYDEAIEHVGQTEFKTNNMQYEKYLHLLGYSITLQDYDRANEYKDSLNKYAIRLFNENLTASGFLLKDNVKKEIEKEKIRADEEKEKIIYLNGIVLLFVCLIACVVIIIIHKRAQKEKDKKLALQLKLKETEKQLAEEKADAMLKEAKRAEVEASNLKRQSEIREKELNKLRQFIFDKYSRKDLQLQLSNNQKPERKIEDESQEKELANIDINDTDWMSLKAAVNIAYDGFTDRLLDAFPKINSETMKICILIKLGFSNSKISGIFVMEESSLKKKLYRMKTEVGLDDKDISFRDFILSF